MAAIDWNTARQVLVALTHDLRPSPTTSSDALVAARKDVAISIVTGQQQQSFGFRLPYYPPRISLPPSQWAQYDRAKPPATPTSAQRAFRRTAGLPSQSGSSLANLLGLKPDVTHGPFLDVFDRPVYVEVFKPIGVQEYSFPDQQPYMFIAAPVTPTGRFEAKLGAGTVWIRADIFTRSNPRETRAPTNALLGLRITSGSMVNPPVSSSPRTLSLKLDGRPSTSTAFAMDPVTDVSFDFTLPLNSATVATLSSIGSGQVVIWGSTFKMQRRPHNAIFDRFSGRLNFAMTADSPTFKPLQNVSTLLNTTGTSAVSAAAWSVMTKTPNQKNFYNASGPGGFSISLNSGIIVNVKGDDMPVALDNCTVIIEPESLFVTGTTARAPMRSRGIIVGAVELSPEQNQGSSFTFRPGLRTPFYYEARLDHTESWTLNADLSFALDQPRTVNNERIPFGSQTSADNRWNTLTWFHDPQSDRTTLNVQAANDLPQMVVSYALKNLLVKADLPANIEIAGVYKAGSVIAGRVRMTSFLRYTLPFLPDPYVSNFEMAVDPAAEKTGLGYMTTSTQWNAEALPKLDMTLIAVPFTAAKTIKRLNDSPRRDDPVLGDIVSGRRKYWEPAVLKKELESGLIPDVGLGGNFHIPDNIITRGGYFHPPTLLDVSSSGSQFGIVFGTRTFIPGETVPDQYGVKEFQVSKLMLGSTSENVRIMTLPAIQWEPVIEADISTVPATLKQEYGFPYSGPSTQMALLTETTRSVRLVPVAPKEAIESLVGNYNSAAPGTAAVVARFSLPFGMVALARVENRSTRATISLAKVSKIKFTLSDGEDPKTKLRHPELQPSDQLSFRPPILFRSGLQIGSSDPSFPGITTLLHMNVRQLPNGPSDLIDPASRPFVLDMASKVPLHRFDISGYGASIFSDWRRVLGSESVGVTKVLMNVINGRTSREVIELQSFKAPFAVRVTKTIEIKRLNSGVVVRHVSDWEPTSVGRYFYKNREIVTHVGVIRGVTDVRNIRETSGMVTVPDTKVEVIMVKFDCIAEIEDGGQIRRVPVQDLSGCIFLDSKDLDTEDGANTYMKVLQMLDLGGQVDTIVQIGKSGQRKRITSLSVKTGLDPASHKQVAVAAAWGSPVFQGGGQWSFAKMGNDGQPKPVDRSKGVPLVREGRHDIPDLGSRVTSYLFRDPWELLTAVPGTVYNIVHGAASHRVMFSSPEIPFAQGVKKGILSKEVWVADSLALGKSVGIFPNLNDCLPVKTGLPDGAKQLLEIVEGGYAFEPKKIINGVAKGVQLDLPSQLRVLKEDASVKSVVETISSASDDLKSTLNLAIDTTKNISKMDITNINMVTHTVSDTSKEASRVIGRLSSDVSKLGGLLGRDIDVPDPEKLFQAPLHKFGPALEQVQKVISFLESLKFLPNFKVSMTNEWAMVMSTSMNREDLLKKIPEPSRPPVEKVIESFDFILSSRTSLSSFLLKMQVGTTVKIPTGFGPIVALGTGAFGIALGTTGIEVKLELGCGIGVDFTVGPFSASASYTQSQTIIFDEDHWGVGITACMRAHIDLVVASADLYLEAKLLVVGGRCTVHDDPDKKHDQTTIWGFAQVRIAVHVSIFLVCNISVDEEAQWESNFNGGPCLLDQMGDLTH